MTGHRNFKYEALVNCIEKNLFIEQAENRLLAGYLSFEYVKFIVRVPLNPT